MHKLCISSSILQEDLKNIFHGRNDWDRFSGKTILITGASGLLASYLVYFLIYLNKHHLQKSCQILCLVRNLEKAKSKFGDSPNITYIEQSIANPINYDKEVHFIIHAASQASPKYYNIDPIGTLEANIIGTQNCLQLAFEKKVESFLFISSGDVYGIPINIPTTEIDYGYIDISRVRSCYGESKRMGEVMCVSWWHQRQVPIKIVRPGHTYGPGLQLDDGRVFADFVKNILQSKNIELSSNGSATRSFCYISDATLGFFTVLLQGANGEAYNISNDKEEISILHLAETLISLYPERKIKITTKQKEKNYLASPLERGCLDISKVKNLGWTPTITIKDGFKRTIQSFIDQ